MFVNIITQIKVGRFLDYQLEKWYGTEISRNINLYSIGL